MKKYVVSALVLFFAPAAWAAVADATIFTMGGEVPLKLEVAATPDARSQGLMYRESMGDVDGMVFLFPAPYDYAFYMKNTPLPLDMLFVDTNRQIVHIEANTKPYSLNTRSSGVEVVEVIELDGGRASREGIAVGDHVDVVPPAGLEIR